MNVADFISFHGEEQFEENAETNPVKIKIENFQIMFQKYNKYINIFKLESLIFSISIENNIKKIFLVTNGLSDTKHLLTYGELFQTEGVKTLSETVNWEKIKKIFSVVKCNFQSQTDDRSTKHFSTTSLCKKQETF